MRLASGLDVKGKGKRGTEDDCQVWGSTPRSMVVVPFTKIKKTRGGTNLCKRETK